MKFSIGDTIVVDEYGKGFERATVTGITEIDGRQYYTLSIICGIATIPISAEINYKLAE